MKILLTIILILIPVIGFAEVTPEEIGQDKWHNKLLGDELLVGSSETQYTTSDRITNSDHHGLFVRVVSAGTVNITITYENALTKNTTFVLPDGNTWSWTITSAGDHIKALTQLAHVGWLRFKVAGAADNDGSGIVDVVFVRDSKQR